MPLLIFATSRVYGAFLLAWGSESQPALTINSYAMQVTDPIPASPGYWGVLANWDGQWYKSIAENGYPLDLPQVDGQVLRNEWAFYPLFPAAVRMLMLVTGLPFEVVAGVLNIAVAGLAVIMLYYLLRRLESQFLTVAAVAMLCFFPSAVVFQVAYTESLTLLVVVATLVSLQRRRYGLVMVAVLVLSLTRPIVLPMAAVVGIHWIVRWRREREDWVVRTYVVAVASTSFAALTFVVWPLAIGLLTGEPDAYLLTQHAWRTDPQKSVLEASLLGRALTGEWRALIFAAGCVLLLGVIALGPRGSRWSVDMRSWVLVYPLYMLIAVQPTTSLYRYLLLAVLPWWPFSEAGATPGTRRTERAKWIMLSLFVAGGCVGQYFWVNHLFIVSSATGDQPFP